MRGGWRRAVRRVELGLAALALGAALVVNNLAGRLASEAGSRAHSSPDLLLGLLPVVDTRVVFVWGFAAFVVWAAAVVLWRERERAARILWLYALLICVRSFFLVLTPMRQPEHALWFENDRLFDAVGRHLTFQHDLFFSSHAALPFLAFLVMRGPYVRLSFLALSILLASGVLVGRLHYSIDVFAAYFITYAVYRAERRWLCGPYRSLRGRWGISDAA